MVEEEGDSTAAEAASMAVAAVVVFTVEVSPVAAITVGAMTVLSMVAARTAAATMAAAHMQAAASMGCVEVRGAHVRRQCPAHGHGKDMAAVAIPHPAGTHSPGPPMPGPATSEQCQPDQAPGWAARHLAPRLMATGTRSALQVQCELLLHPPRARSTACR